jgi:hypothetical protein
MSLRCTTAAQSAAYDYQRIKTTNRQLSTKIAEVRRYKGLSYSLPDLNQLITPQSQIISHFDFSRFIGFAMHLYINIYGSRKAETTNNLEQGSSKEEF